MNLHALIAKYDAKQFLQNKTGGISVYTEIHDSYL